MRIAVLDNDSAQADFVCNALSSEGHVCHVFSEGQALIRQLKCQTFDLLILDWNVPDMSGEDVLRRVRETLSRHLPTLSMTSLSRESDILSMLSVGADDYVVKPVSTMRLLERVDSLLRRLYQQAVTLEVFGEIEFDRKAAQVTVRGLPVELTLKEFELALLLFQHMSRPISRAYITGAIWKQAVDIQSRTIDTHISVLRAKLGLRPENGYQLAPIYGYGYRLSKVEPGEV
jgi:DNA-binding response OmpR family regulator